jgi:hypothetical protein
VKLDPKQVALTAINEAIAMLDYDCLTTEALGALPTDALVEDAQSLLMDARALLTGKPWPELPHPSVDPERFAAWVAERTAEQQKDGRQ